MNPLPTNNFTHPKVTSAHQERLALIYVRQSTPKQVVYNKESQDYQYRLQQRAQGLGWTVERIQVIDSDLGRSGSEATSRVGFQELVAEVSLGHAGIVFGYEVSRLARNNQDWYHLLDLAAVFGTLIADNDGIYDPRLYNDRLLLGLKGTMSEAELHLLRQRLDAGRMNQVRRGAYRQKLPTGLVRLPDGKVVKDPDDQVRHVLELLFAKFEELGSANKVIRYLRQNQVLLPRRQSHGLQVNEVVWKVSGEAAVSSILENPAYAGVFAYGRRQFDPTLHHPGLPATGRPRKPMSEWLECQQHAYPAYISWDQYLANQERIHQNGLRFMEQRQKAQGMVRQGPGLLQGIVLCGHCGYHMHTVYKKTPRYICRGVVRTTIAVSDCNSVRAPVIDEVVVQAFFEALRPAQLDALEAILSAQRIERDRLDRQWQEQLKRGQYQAHLAQRQYNAVDPENRLVAAELERRWEAALQQQRQTEEAYHHFQQTPLPEKIPPALRDMFRDVSHRLPDLWPHLTNPQKKELLRSLIRQVIIRRPAQDQVEIRIVWLSGYYTDHTCLTPIHSEQKVTGYDQMVERVAVLWQEGLNDQRMAEQLTLEGFHSARSATVPAKCVQKIRLAHGWVLLYDRLRNANELEDYWTVNGLAKQVGVNEATIYWYIYKHVIPAEVVLHEPNTRMYLFRKDEALIQRLQERVVTNKKRNGMLKTTRTIGS